MIDWDRVGELRDEIGVDDFLEVVELFLEEVDEVIERMCNSPDPGQYEDDLHFVKGCALNLGFGSLAALCADGETRSAAGDCGSVDIPAVVANYRESKHQFLMQLASEKAA
ncbi:MAG: Hpt domain-containing protein [Rhodobacteraceae bacterium]|nr:Hpt domain-containing protein [Paracoccaceae bacterium]